MFPISTSLPLRQFDGRRSLRSWQQLIYRNRPENLPVYDHRHGITRPVSLALAVTRRRIRTGRQSVDLNLSFREIDDPVTTDPCAGVEHQFFALVTLKSSIGYFDQKSDVI